MLSANAFKETFGKFTQIALSIVLHFHLTGGLFNLASGEPRQTQVIDIVVSQNGLTKFCRKQTKSLADRGLLLPQTDRDA